MVPARYPTDLHDPPPGYVPHTAQYLVAGRPPADDWREVPSKCLLPLQPAGLLVAGVQPHEPDGAALKTELLGTWSPPTAAWNAPPGTGRLPKMRDVRNAQSRRLRGRAVSYTHLTLPTN